MLAWLIAVIALWESMAIAQVQPLSKPTITSPSAATAILESPFSYQIIALGNPVPTSFSATSLPPGLTINPQNGKITGSITRVGFFSIIVTASNTQGLGSQNGGNYL